MSGRFTSPVTAAPALGRGALVAAGLWSAAGLLAAIFAFVRPVDGSAFPFAVDRLPLFAAALAMASASYILRIFRWHRFIIRLIPGVSLRRTIPAQVAAFGLAV